MITVIESVEIRAPAEAVFAYVDDIRNLGWHMTGRSSMAMLGSRLQLEVLSDQPTGLGATYRYSGTMMGFPIDFSESVTKYLPPREKIWRTIGRPRLLIIASYEMRVAVEPLSALSSRCLYVAALPRLSRRLSAVSSKASHVSMNVPEKIARFLRGNRPKRYCDDCIAKELALGAGRNRTMAHNTTLAFAQCPPGVSSRPGTL
jgi:hypothetical protein